MKTLVALAGAGVTFAAALAAADCPPCGPMMCLDDPTFAASRTAKKNHLKAANYPADFVALVDKDGPCQLCLENAPDAFSILVVKANDATESQPWTEEREQFAKDDLKSGAAKAYYVFNVRKRCACCKEKPAEQRPDWDSKLEMSKSLVIAHIAGR
ncbi:MAG: hypothetical protein QM723_18450 [Myxococcaceae bacterium]